MLRETLTPAILHPMEIRRNENLGINSVVTHWGNKIPVNTLVERLRLISNKPDLYSSGFDYVYHSSKELTDEQALAEETTAVTGMINTVLDNSGWERESVICLGIGCGTPPVHNYGFALADSVGLKKACNIDVYAACNSAGRALELICKNDFQGERVVLAGIEGMTRLVRDIDDLSQVDPISMQTFSNAAAAISFIPGKSLKLLTSKTIVEPDTDKNLAALSTYDFNPAGPMLQREFVTVASYIEKGWLPCPENGRIDMKGKGTAMMFLKLADRIVTELMKEYGSDEPLKMIIAHHPSAAVFQLAQRKLEKKGIKAPMPWVVNDGNASGATSLVAFCRLLDQINPGDRFMYLSYGAGATATAMIFEAGGRS